ncbi:hypothetical protein PHMEG_00030952, partial [Phytophthora megakarya]
TASFTKKQPGIQESSQQQEDVAAGVHKQTQHEARGNCALGEQGQKMNESLRTTEVELNDDGTQLAAPQSSGARQRKRTRSNPTPVRDRPVTRAVSRQTNEQARRSKELAMPEGVNSSKHGGSTSCVSTSQENAIREAGHGSDIAGNGESVTGMPHREVRENQAADKRVEARRANAARYREREPTLQLTDDEIIAEQKKSQLVQRLITAKTYRGQRIQEKHGIVVIEVPGGWRVVLPPALWATAFKEAHDSIWAGHLRAPHTYARMAQQYWWPGLQREVKRWVLGCQECGSRKVKPREVIPPLRSLRGGDVGDRWALDVAGPLPTSKGGSRFVIAAVEYVTRYVVAEAVDRHTADVVARFLMKRVVLKFGTFRELMTDGAPELTSKSLDELMKMLQARQTNAVAYRPQMVGLVERFNRTWKDMVATYMSDEKQRDWDLWIDFAVYAYNSGKHSTVDLTPNELMMGRRLRSPNELLRATSRTVAMELTEHHKKLVETLKASHAHAEEAREREQQRQARYYNRQVRRRRDFVPGDRVWVYKPPRGPKATKLVHPWMGPMRIVEPVGYDNWLLEREDVSGEIERVVAHVSFLVSYCYPQNLLKTAAADLEAELENEAAWRESRNETTRPETTRTATAPVHTTTTATSAAGKQRTMASARTARESSGLLVELRRRKRRNAAGQYVIEFELQPVWAVDRQRRGEVSGNGGQSYWVSMPEYEKLFDDDRVVEDSVSGEGV